MSNTSNLPNLIKEKPVLEQKSYYRLERKLFWPLESKRQGEGGLRMRGNFKKSYANKPLISVVTVVYNGQENLEQTINSVLDQTYDNVEYIIIDGGSKDKTLEIIQKYDDKIDYWVSEPDGGIYMAMNKAASLATGDYIAFLNADDWYNNNTVELVVTSIGDNDIDYIYGNTDIYEENTFLSTSREKLKQYKFNTPFGHQSLFVKVKYLLSEPFNTKYKVLADYNFMLGLIIKNLSYKYIDQSIVNYRTGGISSTANLSKEKFRIFYTHFGFVRAVYSYMLIINHPLIKPINTLIHTFRYILKLSVSR